MRKFFLPLLLCGAVVTIVFGKALFPAPDQLIFGDDVHRQYYFFRQYFNNSIREGAVPWWNPYVFSGTPFLANAQVSMLYPLNWLYVILPLNIAYSWYFAIHVFIAMVTMYWLAKAMMGKICGWTAGIVFGLSGYFMARTMAGQPDVVAAASWAPLVIGLFIKVINEKTVRSILLAAAGLAVQLSTGYQIVTLFTLEAVAIIVFINIIKEKSLRMALPVIGAVVLALGLAAVQLLPQQEFFRHSIRTVDLPYKFTASGAHSLREMVTLIDPFALGGYNDYQGSPPNYHEHAIYVGKVALILAILAFVLGRAKPFTLIALFSVWVSFGANAPVDLQYLLWKFTPFYHYIRIPSRHLVLFVLSASILTGFGLSLIRSRVIQIFLSAVIILELVLVGRNFIALEKLPEYRHDQELVNLLKSDRELSRVIQNFGVWVVPRDRLDFGSAMNYKFFSATGYDPSILRNYYEFIDAANGAKEPSVMKHNVQVPYLNPNSPYLNFLNIKYVLVNPDYDPFGGKSTDRFKLILDKKEKTYRLYENKAVLPRFFLSDCGDTVSEPVEVNKYSGSQIELTSSATCDTKLISSEVMYPGWEAAIDGRKTAVLATNHAFRSLLVPKGRHSIKFYFFPRIYIIGGVISLVTFLICLLFWHKDKEARVFMENLKKRIKSV